MQRQMLMSESAEQMPHLTQTVTGVSMSLVYEVRQGAKGRTCERREEDGDQAQEDIRRAHLGFWFDLRLVEES